MDSPLGEDRGSFLPHSHCPTYFRARMPQSQFRISKEVPRLLLAIILVALMVMAGDANALAVFVMTAVGAFLAALPGRIRRRKETRLRSSWQGCLVCFAAGLAMVLAAGLAQMNGRLALGLMQGSVSAWAFAGIAWLAALVAARVKERRRRT